MNEIFRKHVIKENYLWEEYILEKNWNEIANCRNITNF
jgi:hypothetical protein